MFEVTFVDKNCANIFLTFLMNCLANNKEKATNKGLV